MTANDDLLGELRRARPEHYRQTEDRIAFAVLLRRASRTSVADWVMSDQPERDAVHLSGLVRLLAAIGRLFAYLDLPARSRARSDILLAGAAALGIETSWGGWP